MKKVLGVLKEYVIAALIFLILGAILKISETIYFLKLGETITFFIFTKGALSLTIVFCFYSVLAFPLYILFKILNKTLAKIFISILFSWIILFETGLTIYLLNTGTLIGAELIIRPFSETIATIKTVINLWIPVLSVIVAPAIFYFILLLLNKKALNEIIILVSAIFILISATFITITPKLYREVKNPTLKHYTQNKSLYCFHSVKVYLLSGQKYSDVFFDEKKLKEFLQEYPEKKIIYTHYPLERKKEKSNVLGPYFKPEPIKPNIVIIVLESLGREWNDPNPNSVSFTPFLDSLAKTGLYWKNCISTTNRSFGIVPTITGSLPFGIKGFQFGSMPEHHSLIKILKNNHYKTNAFYAGAFYFDAINDYLLAQDMDYMSENFYIHYENNKTGNDGYPYWGYHDSIMFAKTLQDPNFLNETAPIFNLFVTTSAHQNVDRNNPYFKRAYKITNQIISSAPKEKQEYYLKRINRIATIVYSDLCLKDFMENYKKREDFKNTIFIFTGDHASGMMPNNDLSAFHVPLVIWSPLLLSHKTFPALVSHNDFVPTLEALLIENYHLTTSPYSHWLGNALDTSSHFVSNVKTVMFDYSNGYKDMIYNNYYYNNQLYEIQNEHLDLKEIKDNSLTKFMQNKLELYKYIYQYVYLNNKLTMHPIFDETKYKTIIDTSLNTLSVIFNTTPQWESITLYPETQIDGKWKKIKISITADIMFTEVPENQDFYEFIVECKGQNMQNVDYYHDLIHKFILIEDVTANKWFPLNIENQFLTEGSSYIKIKIFFCMGSYRSKNHSKLNNIRVLIEGK